MVIKKHPTPTQGVMVKTNRNSKREIVGKFNNMHSIFV